MTKYPNNYDDNTSLPPASGDDAASVNASIAAIEIIEMSLGLLPFGPYASVRTRLDILEARINNPFSPSPNTNNPFYIGGSPISGVSIQAGFGDPTILLPPAIPGSLYLREDGYNIQGLYAFRPDGYWHQIDTDPWTAAGDLSGTAYSQTVIGIQGNPAQPIILGSAQDGYILTWKNSAGFLEFLPPSDTIALIGDVTGVADNNTVVKIQGNAVQSGILGAPQDGFVLTWKNADNQWEAISTSSNVVNMAGDVTGTSAASTVVKINGTSVSATPSANQVLVATGGTTSIWEQISNAQVSNTAALAVSKLAAGTSAQILQNNGTPTPTWTTISGDMGITNAGVTTVTAIQGNTVTSGALTKGQFFVATSTSNWAATSLSGDLSESATTAGQVTVININGSSVPAGGSLTTGNVLQVNGVSALTYAPVNLAGGSNYVTGTLPVSNLPNLAGDVTGAINTNTVIKIQGNPVEAQTLSSTQDGYVLTWHNAGPYWYAAPSTGGSGGVTWADDLAGSTSSNQYVAAISGNAGAGGTIPINATTLQFAKGQTSPALNQAAQTTDVATNNLTISAQSAYTSAGTNVTGGNLVLQSGAPATTNGTPGNIVIALSAPTGSGSEGAMQFTRGGSVFGQIGPDPGLAGAYSGLWLSGTGLVPSSSNYAVVANSTNTYLNGSGAVNLAIGASALITLNATNFILRVPTIDWTSSISSPTITQDSPITDVATNNLTIQSQAPWASASTNTSPGNIVLNIPAPIGAGTSGYVAVQDNGTTGVAFGKQTEASGYNCIWLAQSAPDSSNYTIAYNNSVMYVSSNNTLILGGSTGNVVVTANGVQLGSVASQFGGAVGAVGITASGGLPTALTTGGISFYANSQALGVNATNIQFPSFITAPALEQTTPTSDVATNNLTIQSQAPFASASTNKTPGSVVLNTPAPIAGGSKGTVLIQDGGATYATFQNSNSGGLGLTGSALTFSGNGTIQTDNSILYLSVASAGGNNQIINWLPVSGGEVVTVADWFTLQDITQAPIARFVTGAGSGNASFNWWYGVTPTYTQLTPVSDVATAATTIRAQSAYGSASTHVTGGNLILSAGIGTTAANDGYVQLPTLAGNGIGVVGIDNSGNLSWSSGGGSANPTVVTKTSGPYTVAGSNYVVLCNQSAGITIQAPSPSVSGTFFTVKDISGAAETNNISITQNGSEKFDNVAATFVFSTNFGGITWISDGTNWWSR